MSAKRQKLTASVWAVSLDLVVGRETGSESHCVWICIVKLVDGYRKCPKLNTPQGRDSGEGYDQDLK